MACSSHGLVGFCFFLQPHIWSVECSFSLPGGCILFISSALSRSTAQPERRGNAEFGATWTFPVYCSSVPPRTIKGSSLRGPLKRAGITNFASIFLFCHGEAAQVLLQTSVGLSFIVVLSSVYPPACNRVADPVGLRHANSRGEKMIVFF